MPSGLPISERIPSTAGLAWSSVRFRFTRTNVASPLVLMKLALPVCAYPTIEETRESAWRPVRADATCAWKAGDVASVRPGASNRTTTELPPWPKSVERRWATCWLSELGSYQPPVVRTDDVWAANPKEMAATSTDSSATHRLRQ